MDMFKSVEEIEKLSREFLRLETLINILVERSTDLFNTALLSFARAGVGETNHSGHVLNATTHEFLLTDDEYQSTIAELRKAEAERNEVRVQLESLRWQMLTAIAEKAAASVLPIEVFINNTLPS